MDSMRCRRGNGKTLVLNDHQAGGAATRGRAVELLRPIVHGRASTLVSLSWNLKTKGEVERAKTQAHEVTSRGTQMRMRSRIKARARGQRQCTRTQTTGKAAKSE
jgi:hypothetical protein